MTNSESSSTPHTTTTMITPVDTSSMSPIPSLPPLITTHIQHLINPKLDHNNFQTWRAHFLSLLEAFELEVYVNGSFPFPPKTLPNSTQINSDFTSWKK